MNSQSKTGHETRDADVMSLGIIAGLLLLAGVIIFLVCWIFLHFLNAKGDARAKPAAAITQATRTFPEPRLQTSPAADLARLRTQEETQLNSYAWIDRAKGVARIPVQRAMQLLLERGLPEVGAGETPLQLMQQRPNESGTPPPAVAPRTEGTP
jgi:hypothetical protein